MEAPDANLAKSVIHAASRVGRRLMPPLPDPVTIRAEERVTLTVTRPEGWPVTALDVGQCRVYWGSHGCDLPRNHPADQPCVCDCCGCAPGTHPESESCVAAPPYYGPGTRFYGEDAAARGLPLVGP